MGQGDRQSLIVWENVFDEFSGEPLTERRKTIAQCSRRTDNAIALCLRVLRAGLSDEAMTAFTNVLDAERKREERATAKAATV